MHSVCTLQDPFYLLQVLFTEIKKKKDNISPVTCIFMLSMSQYNEHHKESDFLECDFINHIQNSEVNSQSSKISSLHNNLIVRR
jgi:hypothetical protein